MSRVHPRIKTVTSLREHAAQKPSAPAAPLYGVALLKVALELKKHPEARVEDVIDAVLTRMRLPEADFRSFLAREGGILRVLSDRMAP